jgi:hypothetical protein
LQLVFRQLARVRQDDTCATADGRRSIDGDRLGSTDDDGATLAYLEPMLPFVLKEFLKQDKPWQEFPYQLLGAQNVRQFCSTFESVLLPVVLWYGKSDAAGPDFVEQKLKELSDESGKEARQLLVDNFSNLMAYSLPTVVADDRKAALLRGVCSKKRVERAKGVHEFCERALTTKKYHLLLNSSMPEILSKILRQVTRSQSYDRDLQRNE